MFRRSRHQNAWRQKVLGECERTLAYLARIRRESRDTMDPEYSDFLKNTMEGLQAMCDFLEETGGRNG